jgi:DNA repair protein RecO (recombination protein O)
MLTKIQGIIIRSIKYGETSLIFDMYTQQYGLASFIVNGARKPKSKLPSSLFQLMNWLEVVAYVKDPRSLSRIKEAQIIFHYQHLPFDRHKSSVALFITEVIQKTIKENEANLSLFSFLHDTFSFLDLSENPIANLHISFLIELSGFLGFQPHGQWCDQTPYFHLVSGQFVEVAHPMYTLDIDISRAISGYLSTSMENIHEHIVTREMRRRVVTEIISFYRYHLDRMPEIKTHKILSEVFD